jgi:beta-galactosidase
MVASSFACAGKVQLWSAERPETYCLLLELKSALVDAELPVESCQLAFRQNAIVQGQLLHNGRPIMLRGVNRHEHEAYTGKV